MLNEGLFDEMKHRRGFHGRFAPGQRVTVAAWPSDAIPPTTVHVVTKATRDRVHIKREGGSAASERSLTHAEAARELRPVGAPAVAWGSDMVPPTAVHATFARRPIRGNDLPYWRRDHESHHLEALPIAASRSGFELMARASRGAPEEVRPQLAGALAGRLAATNPNFDRGRFISAATGETAPHRSPNAPSLTRGHFQLAADAIRELPEEHRQAAAESFAREFATVNPNFDHGRFMKAAGAGGAPPEPAAGTPEFAAAQARTRQRNIERYGKPNAFQEAAALCNIVPPGQMAGSVVEGHVVGQQVPPGIVSQALRQLTAQQADRSILPLGARFAGVMKGSGKPTAGRLMRFTDEGDPVLGVGSNTAVGGLGKREAEKVVSRTPLYHALQVRNEAPTST